MLRALHLGILAVATLISVACLGLSANILNFALEASLSPTAGMSFALAASVISVVMLVPMCVHYTYHSTVTKLTSLTD
jgi:hypothetical protein